MARKPAPPVDGTEQLKHNPFSALAGRTAPSAPEIAPPNLEPSAPVRETKPASNKPLGRVVMRRETKHRGGKAVIVISGFEAVRGFDSEALAALAKRLKQALGCGGTVEEKQGAREIVLQGDKPAKVAELLRAQGFRVDGVTS
jgi:translation initiation factor 1 (eIF-1/SUI1)